MTTRYEAAQKIAEALEADYSASVWSEGSHVRVYLVEITRKSKGRTVRRDMGHVAINLDGSVDCDLVDRQRGAISSLIADLNLAIEPEAATPRVATARTAADTQDALDQLEASDRAIAALESTRELG